MPDTIGTNSVACDYIQLHDGSEEMAVASLDPFLQSYPRCFRRRIVAKLNRALR